MIAFSIYFCLIKNKAKQKRLFPYYVTNDKLIEDFNLDNILTGRKLYENILVYNISYNNLIANPFRIRFDEIYGFIRVYDGTRYLILFGSEKYDSIYNRIRYLISAKSGITYITSHNYAKIKVDSCNFLPLKNSF